VNPETRICQNCKTQFTIEPDDFGFYEKMQVPPPTWCPACQLQRRFCFRNERSLYKRKESLRGEEVISSLSPDKPYKVFTQKDWWSDAWDPMDYGREYDFSRPFFLQFGELMREIPWPALVNWNATNSEYCNYTTDNKNCYLLFGSDFNENCSYGYMNFHSKDSFDLHWVDKLELAYECVDVNNCFKVSFCQSSRDCTESTLLFDCTNCHHSVGCVGLRNRSYCVFNVPYTKEEYEKKVAELGLSTHSGLVKAKELFSELKARVPHKFADMYKSVNCTGDKIQNSKNCRMCFDALDNVEDSKNAVIAAVCKDAHSADHVGWGGELIYDSLVSFSGVRNIRFSALSKSSQNITYSMSSSSSSDLFGCIGLKDKKYCILNKQYTKESFDELVPKIIAHMDEMPYTDVRGMVFKFGEFFPPELSLFAYNESIAQEHFPLTKEEAVRRLFPWRESEEKQYRISMKPEDVPDSIADVTDAVLYEVIGCAHGGTCAHQCATAFKLVLPELQFYRKMRLPLPRLCSNCRHYERLRMRNPMKLWHRACDCRGAIAREKGKEESGKEVEYRNTAQHQHGAGKCPNEFETSYAPERKEIVYCEPCYNAEIA
jgi:hypothetical protein